MAPKNYSMQKISLNFYDILTQVTFKFKTRFCIFFFFKHKSKNTQGFGVKADWLLKFNLQKMLRSVFYLH